MQENKKLKRRVRNSYIVSTVSIAMVLFLLGSVGYLIVNAIGASDRMKESMTVHVMLAGGLTDDQTEETGRRLMGTDGVREVKYVSKAEAAAEFIDYIGSDFTEFLDFNPLPDSYEVKLNAADTGPEAVERFEQRVAAWPEVSEVVYQKGVVDKIGPNVNKFNLVLLVFGAALLVISLILLNNTIRITIFSKRYIISTMKLVGATKWFVMKPFLKTSILQGIYSALIASVMFAALVAGLHEGLPELKFVTGNTVLIWIVGGMFVVGVLISLLFTTFAVNKFVRMHTDAVHFY